MSENQIPENEISPIKRAEDAFVVVGDLIPPHRALTILFVLILINTIAYADRNLFSVLIPYLKSEFNLTDGYLGLLAGPAFVVPYILLSLPISRLGDNWSKSGAIAICASIWGLASAACGLASHYIHLLIARLMVGAGEAGVMPSSQAIVAELYPPEKRSGPSGALAASTYLGLIVGIAGGGAVASLYGWRTAFFALSLPVLALIPILITLVPIKARPLKAVEGEDGARRSMIQSLKFFIQNKTIFGICLGVGIFHILAYSATTWIPTFLSRSHGMSLLEAATWLGFSAAFGGLGGSIAGGIFSDYVARFGDAWRLRVPAIALILSFPVFLGFLAIPSSMELGRIPAVVFLMFAFSFLSAMWAAPCYASVSMQVLERERAQVIAATIVFINLIGSVLGPPLAGFISDAFTSRFGTESMRYSLLTLSPLALIGGLVLLNSAKAKVSRH